MVGRSGDLAGQNIEHFTRFHGIAEQAPLSVVATMPAQEFELLACFHAFGNPAALLGPNDDPIDDHLRLAPVFVEWLERTHPDRAGRVLGRVRAARGGRVVGFSISVETTGSSVYAKIPFNAPFAAPFNAVFTSSVVVAFEVTATRSTTETFGVGTRMA